MDGKIYSDRSKSCDSFNDFVDKSSSRESSPLIDEPSGIPTVTITAANLTSGTKNLMMTEIKTEGLDKVEINQAVTKVLKGYNWLLVPTPTK